MLGFHTWYLPSVEISSHSEYLRFRKKRASDVNRRDYFPILLRRYLPLGFSSRKLQDAEPNYDVHDKELLYRRGLQELAPRPSRSSRPLRPQEPRVLSDDRGTQPPRSPLEPLPRRLHLPPRTPTWQTLYRTRCPFPEEAVQYQPGGPCSTTTMPATFSLVRDDHHQCVRHLRRRHRRRCSPQRRVLPSLDRFTELPQRLPSRVHSTSRPSRPLTRRPRSREPLQALYRRPVSTPSSSPSSTGSPR